MSQISKPLAATSVASSSEGATEVELELVNEVNVRVRAGGVRRPWSEKSWTASGKNKGRICELERGTKGHSLDNTLCRSSQQMRQLQNI